MLSKSKYSALCALGVEIFYVICIAYGFLLAGRAMELHHSLFELIPGFAWTSPASWIWGAVSLGIFAWIVGWYVAWMHNVSLVAHEKAR